MDVGASFVADAQAAVLVEPGDRARANTGAVWLLRPRDRGAMPRALFAAVAAGVVGAVAEEAARPTSRTAAFGAHGRDCIQQRQRLEDVVVVAAPHREASGGPVDK